MGFVLCARELTRRPPGIAILAAMAGSDAIRSRGLVLVEHGTREVDMDWDFRVVLFAGARHPGAREGERVYEVSLKGETTAALEIHVSQGRMRKGEILRAELIDLRVGGKLTNLDVRADTQIPWADIGNRKLAEKLS
jgi:hypothetical protein